MMEKLKAMLLLGMVDALKAEKQDPTSGRWLCYFALALTANRSADLSFQRVQIYRLSQHWHADWRISGDLAKDSVGEFSQEDNWHTTPELVSEVHSIPPAVFREYNTGDYQVNLLHSA